MLAIIVIFDDNGEVKSYSGNPILLNSSVAMDPAIKAEVDEFNKAIVAEGKKEVGKVNKSNHIKLILSQKIASICNLNTI